MGSPVEGNLSGSRFSEATTLGDCRSYCDQKSRRTNREAAHRTETTVVRTLGQRRRLSLHPDDARIVRHIGSAAPICERGAPAHPQNGRHGPIPRRSRLARCGASHLLSIRFPQKRRTTGGYQQWPFLRTAERTWRGWLGSRNLKLTLCLGRACDGHHNRADFTRRLRQIALKCACHHRTGRIDAPTFKLKLASRVSPKIHSAPVLGVAVRTFLPGRRPLVLNASRLGRRCPV